MPLSPRNSEWRTPHDRAALPAPSRSDQVSGTEMERRRQELGAAMEDELHQIVSNASQAISDSWKRAELQKAAKGTRRFSLPWILALVVFLIALAGVGYETLRTSQRAEPNQGADVSGLGLKVEMKRNLVLVSWDKNAPLITKAKRGRLFIKDGMFQNDLTLPADLLVNGTVNYYHKTKDITFQLQVVTDGNRTTSEVVRLHNHTSVPLPTPVSINLNPQQVGPIGLLENSKAASNPTPNVSPEVPSNKGGSIKGTHGLAPKRPRTTAPRVSQGAISAPPVEKKEPAAPEGTPLDLTALKSAKVGVPQTWRLVVEYLGLTPVVSAQADTTLSSSNPSMEGFLRLENDGTARSQAMTPRSNDPAPGPQESAKDVSPAEEPAAATTDAPSWDSVLLDSPATPTPVNATGSEFSSLVQCPENSKVTGIPFASGRPDRKTVSCGERIAIIREFGDWVRIRTTDGFEGHVLRRFVK